MHVERFCQTLYQARQPRRMAARFSIIRVLVLVVCAAAVYPMRHCAPPLAQGNEMVPRLDVATTRSPE